MTEKPLVSVIINCYNGEKYLREAIDSVIAQTYENWELVFWDNQSTDSTREIVESYKNPKIKYFYAPEHTPLGEARNLAVEKANGEYINFLDADDVWMPEKLEKQIALVEPGKVAVVYTNYQVITNTEHINQTLFKALTSTRDIKGVSTYQRLLDDNYIIFSSVLFNKDLFVQVGGIAPEFKQNEDYDVLLKCALKGNFGCVNEVMTSYRVHDSNNTNANQFLAYTENRIIFSGLSQDDYVRKAIKKNETRVALYHMRTGHIYTGICHLLKKGDVLCAFKLALNKIKRI